MAILKGFVPWLGALVLMAGCRTGPEQWGPFRGHVVDAETGQPIAGAPVMVQWIRDAPSLHSGQRFYDAQEAVTDAEGNFEIPRRTRVFTAFVTGPGFSVFAPGYEMQEADVVPPVGRPYVDPTVVGMRPLKTREERCKYRPREPWASGVVVPRFVKAVQEYNIELDCSGFVRGVQ